MKAASAVEQNCSPQLLEPNYVSASDLAGLLNKLDQLTEGMIRLAASISDLAASNQTLADAVMSQPDEGEEDEQGYLS